MPINNEQTTVVIDDSYVTGLEPSINKGIRRRFGIVEVATHKTRSANKDFAPRSWLMDAYAPTIDKPCITISKAKPQLFCSLTYFASTLGSNLPTLPLSSRSGHLVVVIHPASVIP